MQTLRSKALRSNRNRPQCADRHDGRDPHAKMQGVRSNRGAAMRTIAKALWLLVDPAGLLQATTTAAERKAMGVKLPQDD